ncbi:hypothetical protein THAOC_33781, partial [Thalassiosira oceanica]
GGEKKAGKLRFRVRLIFGVRPTVGADSGDDDESCDSSPGLGSPRVVTQRARRGHPPVPDVGPRRLHGSDADALDCYSAAYASPSCASSSVASVRHGDGPVFLNSTMTVNYLGRLSAGFVRESRDEARAALRAIHGGGLGGGGKGAFGELFLTGRRFWGRYDAYLRLPVGTLPGPPGGMTKNKEEADDYGGDGTGRAWGADGHDLGHGDGCRPTLRAALP